MAIVSSQSGDNDVKGDAKELLLKEYDGLSESIWKNEATGETRVNWFIGIVTVGVGALLKLVSADHHPQRQMVGVIVIAGLLGLLAFGFVTLCRMIRRNKRTDAMIQSLDEIRQIFRDHFDGDKILAGYRAFGRSADQLSSVKKSRRGFGGLADLVLTINSLLVAGIVMATVLALSRPSVITDVGLLASLCPGFIGFWFGFFLQYLFVRRE